MNEFAGQRVHGASPVADCQPGTHSPAGIPVGAALPASVILQPTSIVPFCSSRSHALSPAWPGTPSASTASVAVVSPSLFQPAALLKVASVKLNEPVELRPFRSFNGTRNSTTSFAAEIAICEPGIAYQLPESNHSISGLPEPETRRDSCRFGRSDARTARPLSSPRNA